METSSHHIFDSADELVVEERLSAKAIRSAAGTGAIFHKIKVPLFGETRCFTAMIYGEYLEGAGACSFGMPMCKIKMDNTEGCEERKNPSFDHV